MRSPVVAGLLACVLAWLRCGGLHAAPPALMLQVKPAQRIEAILATEIETPGVTAKEWFLVIGLPPELPCQTQVSGRLTPGGKKAVELSSLSRPILSARVPATAPALRKKVSVEVRYEATLLARKLVPADPKAEPVAVKPPTAQARKAALATSPTLDFQKVDFQAWLKDNGLLRRKSESDIDFARRTYKHILTTCTYEFRTDLDRHSSAVCRSCKSDCGGLSALLVSALRANDVPARLLVGHRAESDKPGEHDPGQAHVRAEFFAEDVGWVPVDVTDALTSKNDDHFGNDPGDLLVQHVDLDLVISAGPFGRQNAPQLQNLAYWVSGSGTTDGSKLQYTWKVSPVPLPPAPGR